MTGCVLSCTDTAGRKFLGECLLPPGEAVNCQKRSNALVNLGTLLLHLRNNLSLSCVGVRLEVLPDFHSLLSKSGLQFLLLLGTRAPL